MHSMAVSGRGRSACATMLSALIMIVATTTTSPAQETIAIYDFRGLTFGGASWGSNCRAYPSADGSEVTLTEVGKPYCAGSVLVTKAPICASEYLVSMEVSSSSGGDGEFALEEMVSRPAGYTSVDLDHATSAVVNRSYYFGFAEESVMIANNNDWSMPPTVTTRTSPAFTVRGTGWHRVSVHVRGNAVEGSLSDGTKSSGVGTAKQSTAGRVIFPYIVGSTGPNGDGIRVRNVQVTILRPDTCDGLLGVNEAQERVESICGSFGDCSLSSEFLRQCTLAKLQELRSGGSIYESTLQQVLQAIEAGRSFCDGLNRCTENLDLEQIRRGAFEEGYRAGLQSVPACPTPAPTASPTPTPGPGGDDDDGDDEDDGGRDGDDEDDPGAGIGRDEAKQMIDEFCPCNGSGNHGRYVSCVSKVLMNLSRSGLLDEELKGELQSEAARSRCGKSSRKRRS